MLSTLTWVLLIAVVIGLTVLIFVLVRRNNNTNQQKLFKEKGIFSQCQKSSDCNIGFICEIRNHPTIGVCVVSQGGNCAGFEGLDEICYTGYTCDKDDKTCVRK